MTTKSGIIIFAVVATVIAAIFVYYAFLLPEEPLVSPAPTKTPEIVSPPVTGNIDDVIDALLKELSDEESVFIAEEGDTVLVTGDSQEVGDFGQSINESEF
ncbi:hypothetical protein IH779_02370 [Patescibacteria group bacterium]|nr:hypothetical protein [Patescibacteria group bacterium]